MSQCDLSQNLLKKGCKARYIENPSSISSILKNKPLSSKGSMSAQYDVIQIQPQKISLSLRPGMAFVCKCGWIQDFSNVLCVHLIECHCWKKLIMYVFLNLLRPTDLI